MKTCGSLVCFIFNFESVRELYCIFIYALCSSVISNHGNYLYISETGHGSGPWSEPRPLGNRGHEVTDADSANTLRRRPRPFGANIHTLGSEDHGPSDERNVFWNGNSTEFGGDDRK